MKLMNPFSMFTEKDTMYADAHWSMTRVVAWLFALTMCYAIGTMAYNGHAHDLGWPFCFLGVATLLAVPLQMLFKNLQTWVASPPGKKVVEKMLEKISGVDLPGPVDNIIKSVTTNTTINTDKDKGSEG